MSNTCQALVQKGENKGEVCGKLTDSKYCKKHQRQEIIDRAKENNIRYCDVSRGCFTVLENHQSKCEHCLHKARICDRKRDDKKRQDTSLCLDCGNKLTKENQAVGKHEKKLRRCIKCYEKLLKIESERKPRERNYKAEAFTNKHVIWNHYVKGAKKRGMDFKLKKDTFNSLIIEKCFYCNHFKDGEVNGIDRIDNNIGYIEDNVVSCCQNCNIMKGSQHPLEFIDKLQAIYLYNTTNKKITSDIIEKWKTTYISRTNPNFKSYSKSANSRNLEFKLLEEDFMNIIKKDCYLCGISTSEINKNGIDRFNNSVGYILENCRPCCGHCNLLKRDLIYDKIIEISGKISNQYDKLIGILNNKNINIRSSKIEPRVKIENPTIERVIERDYKPLNEVIIPKEEMSNDIKMLLENNITNKEIIPKQWKVKQIYEAISTNNENQYKLFCEKNNDISKITDWDTKWATFVLSVKGKSESESEQTIRSFVEDLRRIRHNELCVETKNVVERDDRQLWPAKTIVKAFLDNKIYTFKQFTEEQTGDKPEDPQWQKRWNSFVEDLENNKNNEKTLKNLCSKFLTAQRTKRYRHKITSK